MHTCATPLPGVLLRVRRKGNCGHGWSAFGAAKSVIASQAPDRTCHNLSKPVKKVATLAKPHRCEPLPWSQRVPAHTIDAAGPAVVLAISIQLVQSREGTPLPPPCGLLMWIVLKLCYPALLQCDLHGRP